MSEWKKIGIAFDPAAHLTWAAMGCTQATPWVFGDRIRLFCGMRDEHGVSRAGWVDFELEHPDRVIGWSKEPVLDVGKPGAFDDNGVVPAAIIAIQETLYMYYIGYQLGTKVRFLAFTGVAISTDNGFTFRRLQENPVMDRVDGEHVVRALHSIIYERNIWKVWYSAGGGFAAGTTKTLPVYAIHYLESPTPFAFNTPGQVVLSPAAGEYRLGRPMVYPTPAGYEMYFSGSSDAYLYRLAYATSADGLHWSRNDSMVSLPMNPSDFDSEMSGYPAVIYHKNSIYLFYNGNNYGEAGIGLALKKIEHE